MIKLMDDSFKPLERFVYRERWISSKGNVLSFSDLSKIHPLKKECAQDLWKYAYAYFFELSRFALFSSSKSPNLDSPIFTTIQHINIDQSSLEEVQIQLKTFQPEDQEVIVMWDEETAVVVTWHVLCHYWDDFYCSGLDDTVVILPISEKWILLYHEDYLMMGQVRLPLLNQEEREIVWNPPAKPLVHRDEVIRLLAANKKIDAIKLYQQDTGVGLKRAKDAIDKMLAERNATHN
jgi:hypothetical protein